MELPEPMVSKLLKYPMTFSRLTPLVNAEVLNNSVITISLIMRHHHSDSGAISHQNLSDGKRLTDVSARSRHKMSVLVRGRRRENINVLRCS